MEHKISFVKGMVMSLFLILSTMCYSNVHYVDTLASGAENGTSWTDAYKSLQDALTVSVTGDTIFIMSGVYLPHISDNSVSFNMIQGIEIYGGFSGTELLGDAGFWSNRDAVLYETILSGDINGDDIGTDNNTDNSLHIITNSVTGIVLDGLTLQGGNATGDNGGAIYSTAGSMTFNNLKFFYNMAQLGGAIAMYNTTYAVDSCVFYANNATSTGGALYNLQSDASYSNCVFLDNYVTYSTSNDTQTIYSRFATSVTFMNTIFWLNEDIPGDMISDSDVSNTYSYCLIKGSPSYAWYSNYGNDGGNNITGYPHFVDYENLDFDLYDDSPAINAGNAAYGDNIGYYQGSGVPSPAITITESLTPFGEILVGDSSAEQNYTVSGSNLLGNLFIIAPDDFELTLISGDYTGKTDSLTLVPSTGTIVTTTVYVRFKPTVEGIVDSYILHNSIEFVDPDTLNVSGSGVVPALTVQTNTIPFGNIFLHEHSDEESYTVSGSYLSGPIVITTPDYFEITVESGNYSGNTDTITIETVDGMVPDTTIYVRFSPILSGITSGFIRHETEGPIVSNKLVNGIGTHGPVFYVDSSANGNNDGSNWENAFTNLQSAFLNVDAGDTIVVAKGVYKPHASARDSYFDMVDGVIVLGGFAGNETIDSTAISDRDFVANKTTLSGDLGDNDHLGTITDNCYKVVRFYGISSGFTEETVLDGFTISGGNGDGASSDQYRGGGIYMLTASGGDCSPILRNLIMENNRARSGGAIYLQGAIDSYTGNYTTFENVVFRNNSSYSASGAAGAVYISSVPNFEGSPTFTNCAFLNNSSEAGAGAVYVSGGYIGGAGYSYPVFNNVTFYGNTSATNVGDAIYINGQEGEASPEFINTIVYGTETNKIYKFVTTGSSNPTYSHCLISGSPSTSWNTNIGSDLGNNIDGDPMFVDAENNIVSVYTGSPVLGAGDATYGNNIGYYQEAGEATPGLLISNQLTYFGVIEVGEVSAEQQFDVSGSDLLGNILITTPTGYEISTNSGVAFINESPISLEPLSGTVAATTIYVRFAPKISGNFLDSIQITTIGLSPAYLVADGYAAGKPSVSAIANIDACTGDPVQTAFTVTDDDVSTCTVIAVSDNQSLLPDDSISVVGGIGNYDLYITPPVNSSGLVNISVTVTDSESNDSTITFDLNLTAGPALEVDFTQKACSVDDASLEASASGGKRPVEYWSSSTGIYSADSNFYNLWDGSYVIIARDANSCTDTSDVYEVLTPGNLYGYSSVAQEISCTGDSNGIISVTAEGGWGGYEYSLDNVTFQKDSAFSGLSASDYSVTISDSLGCTVPTQVLYLNTPLELTIADVTIYESNQEFGINIVASGGSGELMYSLDGENYQQDSYYSNVDPGAYTAYVKDNNDCLNRMDFNVGSTGHNELFYGNQFIYPNPVQNILYLVTEDFSAEINQISIISNDGRMVLRNEYSPSNEFSGSIDVSVIETGIYTLYLIFKDNRVFVQQIAIMR